MKKIAVKFGTIWIVLLMLISIFLSPMPMTAQGQVTEEWVVRYNHPSNSRDYARDIAIDHHGNLFVAGTDKGEWPVRNDYAVVKYDSAGNQEWVASYDGPAQSLDTCFSVAVDNTGNVFLTGESWGSRLDIVTIKYDSEGNKIWVNRYDGPARMYESALDMAVDKYGNVYVTGYSEDGGREKDCITIKYANDGNLLWVALYSGPENARDMGREIAVDENGNVFVTGISYGIGTSSDMFTIMYDTNGNEVWVQQYDGPGHYFEFAEDITLDNNGNVYVTGQSYGIGTSRDYVTIKYSPTGNEEWVTRYNGPGNDYDTPTTVVVNNDGNIYVTGWSYNSDGNEDCVTIKYDQSGGEIWVRRYNGPENSWDGSIDMVLDARGNIFITGVSDGVSTGCDFFTLMYDPEGNEEWVARYDGPASLDDESSAIVVDSSGNVYVAGWDRDSVSDIDFVTIKYSTTFADAGPNQTVNNVETVTFDGSGSYDTDGTIVSYAWDFGDGQFGSGVTTTHSYDYSGTYTVTLTVTDEDEATDADTMIVTVKTPIESIQDLIRDVKARKLPPGIENSLVKKLGGAIAALERGQNNVVINKLEAFAHEVDALRGKWLSDEDADDWTAKAQRIISLL